MMANKFGSVCMLQNCSTYKQSTMINSSVGSVAKFARAHFSFEIVGAKKFIDRYLFENVEISI